MIHSIRLKLHVREYISFDERTQATVVYSRMTACYSSDVIH